MTAPEYFQMRAFARVDGLKLFALWIVSFICYVGGLHTPGLGIPAMLLALYTPFLAAKLLRGFRDKGLDGIISFGRGWVYVLFLFLYAGLLFAACQFVYFSYLDHGFFMNALTEMLNDADMTQSMRQLGMDNTLAQSVEELKTMRPIDLALNILTSNLMTGCILALPIAAWCRVQPKNT